MAKTKLTVTIDDDLVATLRSDSETNISAVVNRSLREHLERHQRRIALSELLAEWDDRLGPISDEARATAAAAFDEADGGHLDQAAS